jgi:ribosomal protein S1
MEVDLTWGKDLLARFPGWRSDAAAEEWPAVKAALVVGQPVSGVVVARAPFGVWLDIGVPIPALLLVPEMREAKQRRITFADYPQKGKEVHGRIIHLGDRGQISITQQDLQETDQPRVE